MYLKKEKGVTLIGLAITIAVMLIISCTVIYSSSQHLKIQKMNDLFEDIDNINKRIDDYYLKNGTIPIFSKIYCNNEQLLNILKNNAGSNSLDTTGINTNDGNEYYVIDLDELGGLVLKNGYGSDYQAAKANPSGITTNLDEVFIINKRTHRVYYPAGVVNNGTMYYSYGVK